MDLLIGIVIAVFIIAAVFVGYHASRETYEVAEGHGEMTEFNALDNQDKQSIQILYVKAALD